MCVTSPGQDLSARFAEDYKESIDDVVLVGGSCHIPRLQALLRTFLGERVDVYHESWQDNYVAKGAAVQAAILGGVGRTNSKVGSSVVVFAS